MTAKKRKAPSKALRRARTQVGQQIAAWRIYCGLSQEECAGKIGITGPAWSQWETGDTSPTQENLFAAIGVFRITIAQFWGPVPMRPEPSKAA